jgi:hypothetical protein
MTENISGNWNQNKFRNVESLIPDTMFNCTESVRVKFKALSGNNAGKVNYD